MPDRSSKISALLSQKAPYTKVPVATLIGTFVSSGSAPPADNSRMMSVVVCTASQRPPAGQLPRFLQKGGALRGLGAAASRRRRGARDARPPLSQVTPYTKVPVAGGWNFREQCVDGPPAANPGEVHDSAKAGARRGARKRAGAFDKSLARLRRGSALGRGWSGA
jgi:hypothetical protein